MSDRREMKEMKLLVGYEGSAEARRALEWAARLTQGIADSAITVVSVVPTLEATEAIADAVDPSSPSVLHQRHLDEAAGILKAAGINVKAVLRAGNPAQEIIDMADSGEFDLVLVGSRGVGAVRRFLMGSVSERVVRHASTSVLVAR
jgi:nucleotide-binding universal stress UspA family protein